MTPVDAVALAAEGQAALDRGDWEGARTAFSRSFDLERTPIALEGLATALWWQEDHEGVLQLREQAINLYRAAGDPVSAARVAAALAIDYVDYRGDFAVASGWMQHAEHLLEAQPLSPEHAWMHVHSGMKALMADVDLNEARRRRVLAEEVAQATGEVNARTMALALEGLIMLKEGDVRPAMMRMDEAMIGALGGEMSDLRAIGNLSCFVIYACEAVADYDRASQWCVRTREFCRRLGMDAFFAICRNYYATVLTWRDEWDEAERELSSALQHLPDARPTYVSESLAKLGEIRRRQGRLDEAENLFKQADPNRLALMGRAAITLDSGDPETALDLLERQLRRIGDEDRAERVFAQELIAKARLAMADVDGASAAVADIETTVSIAGTLPLRAAANRTQAALARAIGEPAKAKLHYEDAIDLFVLAGSHFEAAVTRLDLAEVLKEQVRQSAALEQAMLAQDVFKRLGSALYARKAADLIAALGGGIAAIPGSLSRQYGLTARESEVLGLIALGRTNQEIADALVLSVRTVERHISTIYEKLHVQGPAARASAAAIAAAFDHDT